MDNARKQLVEKIQSANHILVTVSNNPSVDQLSACIGLTLVLNKLGKHGTAVFSGNVPSTLEFLKPDETLEKNTDSLRDFIIALDKSKADKLRYKVEDNVVRIFITPYKTSISEKDLEFSQGDFNVDVVIALGVRSQEDLDQAITAHGRILHDATVATVNIASEGSLGSINWNDPAASSLSELTTELAQTLGEGLLDEQIATALLTGIVAETDRFSNEKTTPQTMSLSAALMAAGANQQLVASKLDEPPAPVETPNEEPDSQPDSGSESTDEHEEELDENVEPEIPTNEGQEGDLAINHDNNNEESVKTEEPELAFDSKAFETEEQGNGDKLPDMELPQVVEEPPKEESRLVSEPQLGGQLTANSGPEVLDPAVDPLTMTLPEAPALLDHANPTPEPTAPAVPEQLLAPPAPQAPPAPPAPVYAPVSGGFTPPPPAWVPPSDNPLNLEPQAPASNDVQTLSDIEAIVAEEEGGESLDAARDEVMKALGNDSVAPAPAEPQAESQPLFDSINASESADSAPVDHELPPAVQETVPTLPIPPTMPTPVAPKQPQLTIDPNAPPPVPPPIPFNFGQPQPPQQ